VKFGERGKSSRRHMRVKGDLGVLSRVLTKIVQGLTKVGH
jgi:hypothetical protein